MLLSTLALGLSLGLRYESSWFCLWVIVWLSPPWLLFVKICEERELRIALRPILPGVPRTHTISSASTAAKQMNRPRAAALR